MPTRCLHHLLGSFTDALSNPTVTEVVVNEPGRFGVEVNGAWSWHDDPSLTFDRLDAIGILAAFESSQDLSPASPLVGATLPGGERIQVCRPPATLPGIISLTIRKPSERSRRIDDDDFAGLFAQTNGGTTRRSVSDEKLVDLYHRQEWADFFRLAVKSRKTIGACGATGSGKTDLLKRFLEEIPATERVVTIEDAAEFRDAGPPNKVALFHGDGRANLTAEGVLKAALRMRPDRIVVQEVRGPEAFGFIRALAAGHPGGCTSWHAEEGQEWDALELMIKQHPAGVAIPDAKVRELLKMFIDVVIWASRDDSGFKVPRVWFKAAEAAP